LTRDEQDGRRAAGASPGVDFTWIAAIFQQYFAGRLPLGQAPPKEKRAFIQRIPEDGSGSALTLILRKLNIYIR
jgi:hypothetical protein